MTNKYEELAKRVEAGEICGLGFSDAANLCKYLGIPVFNDYLNNALEEGSLDAAKALHEAVLPGWVWTLRPVVHTGGPWWVCDVAKMFGEWPEPVNVANGMSHASTPAAAWVAAILRAKGQEYE